MISVRTAAIAAKNVLLGTNLSALKLLHKPQALVRYAGECLFMERVLNSTDGIPQRQVCEVFGHPENLDIWLNPHGASQWFLPSGSYTADLVGLCLLARVVNPKVVFEIGTLEGSSALHFAMNAKEAHIYSLDLPPEGGTSLAVTEADDYIIKSHPWGKHILQNQPDASRITLLYGDSAIFDYGPYKGTVDLFFIDGAHSYEYVRNDTLKALECVRKGGVIAWHDYGRTGVNGVSNWLHEFRKQRPIQRVPGGSLAYAIID